MSATFVGRLTRVILDHTSVASTIYLDHMNGWYDLKTNLLLVGLRTFTLLHQSMGVFGLSGIDQVLSFKTVQMLQQITQSVESQIAKNKAAAEVLSFTRKELEPTPNIPTNASKLYLNAVSKLAKFISMFVEKIVDIGQMQLIRRQIANNLNFSVKLDSNILACALDTLNQSLLADIKRHYKNPQNPYPSEDNLILSELTKYLETTGMNDPLVKIYITKDLPTEDLGMLMFLVMLSQVSSSHDSKNIYKIKKHLSWGIR